MLRNACRLRQFTLLFPMFSLLAALLCGIEANIPVGLTDLDKEGWSSGIQMPDMTTLRPLSWLSTEKWKVGIWTQWALSIWRMSRVISIISRGHIILILTQPSREWCVQRHSKDRTHDLLNEKTYSLSTG